MLGLSNRCVRLAGLGRSQITLSRAPIYLQSQWRDFGSNADIKIDLKNETVKNKRSFEKTEKTEEQLQSIERQLKDDSMSMAEEVSNQFQKKVSQASGKLKMLYEKDGKAPTIAKKNVEANSDEDAANSQSTQDADQSKIKREGSETSDILDGARTFINKIFVDIFTQSNKVVNSSKWSVLSDEWKVAAQELFGRREKQTVDEALASVKAPSMQKARKSKSDDEKPTKYSGTSALVAVKEDESTWLRVSARLREAPIIKGILEAAKQAAKTETGKKVQQRTKQVKNKISDVQEEVLEIWETSQNPWMYRLSSIYDGLFGETSMGVAIKEIRRAEPNFILEEWKRNIEETVLPGVLKAFLLGNSRDLKKWFGEAAYSRVNLAIRERKSAGLVMDPHVLSIDNAEVMEATAEDKQAPIILMRFQAQQINCIRNREGEVVDGSEDEVLAYFYVFAFQRNYDEEQETLQWKIVDLHMQRGERYY